MAKVEYTFKLVDSTDGTTEEVSVVAPFSAGRKEAKRKAFTKLANNYTISPQQAEKTWDTDKKIIGFANPPWSNGQDLLDALKAIDGVNSIFSQPPGRGAYGPPKVHLHLDSSAKPSNVEQKVINYYEGLTIASSSGRKVTVIVSATHAN